MEKLNHELFGEISYDLYWSGEQKINIYGEERDIILSIDGDENAQFQDAQKEAYSNFIHNIQEIMDTVEEAIFNYYQEIYVDYRDMVGADEADKIAPIVEKKESLANLVTPTQLIVRRVRNNGIRRLGLLFDCTWNIENGLAVKFEDEEVVEVGFQDIVL